MNEEGQVGGHRAELYVRSLLPSSYSQRQDEVVQRVGELVEQGVLTERRVQPCGQQLPATPAETKTDIGEWLLERFFRFREWATANDCDLAPAFEVREVDDSLTDTRYRAIRPPAILLAEFRERELVCVTPHRDGETVRTVMDRLSTLEAGRPTPYKPVTGPTTERSDAPLVRR